jgi:hypothetical protein
MVKETYRTKRYVQRVAMVFYLLDVVRLDVNANDQPPGRSELMQYGTPICYIPRSSTTDTDTRELTLLLLDRGADPTPALKAAELNNYPRFAQYIEEWTARRGGGGSEQGYGGNCCVQ